MIGTTQSGKQVRQRIEALGTTISLPTVRKALGTLEGEHSSNRLFGSDDVMDIRVYTPGDEVRLVDWKTSARAGRPMVVQRERLVTSHVWMLLDVGREMQGSSPSGEYAYEIAANALCMFAALSLRRSDDVSLVFGNAASIVRIAFHGGLAQFENTLDHALSHDWDQPRNIDALLDYARRLHDTNALIVLATDEHAITERQMHTIRAIARTHPLVIINVATINPFLPHAGRPVVDGASGRRVPAFLKHETAAQEVSTHREFTAAALERELTSYGSTMIRCESSDAMFTRFIHMVSTASRRFHPAAPTVGALTPRSGGVVR